MIVQTKTGVRVSGTVARDPEVKTLGGKDVLKLNIKAQNEKDEGGSWHSLFVDVLCWGGLAQRDGMYQKGDFVAAEGRALQRREYPEGSGKLYYSLSADSLLPGDLVVLRWMQQVVDMIPDSFGQAAPSAQSEFAPTGEPTPFDALQGAQAAPAQTSLDGAQMYPGETLADYAPRTGKAGKAAQPAADLADELARQIDATDAEDLPF